MTEQDKQWLESHGFVLDKELSKRLERDTYVKRPIDTEVSLLKIYIQQELAYWKFFLLFPYNNEHIKFAQVFPMLTDGNLEHFILRWNQFECVDMLKKMNKEYFIPEAMMK